MLEIETRSEPDIELADLVEESVAVLDLQMHVKTWNTEAERLYGWKREEVIGGRIQAAVRCSPSEPLSVIVETVLSRGKWRGEFSRTTKTGETVVVAAKWSLRRDQAGRPFDIVETSKDITAARAMEQALDRVTYQYQNLFQASVASFWELDFSAVGEAVLALKQQGVENLRRHLLGHPEVTRRLIRSTAIVDVNEQSFVMFGRGDRKELLSSLDPLWPDESLHVFAESVASAFEKKAHYSSEAVFYSLSGRRLDTLFTVSYPPQMLRSSRLLVGIIDVTDAKRAKLDQAKSEQRYRDFFHFLPVSLWQLEGAAANQLFSEARAQGVVDFMEYLDSRPEVVQEALRGLNVVEVNQCTVEMLRGRSAADFVGSVERYWTESPSVFRQAMAARYAGQKGFEAEIKIAALDGTVIDALFFAAFAPVTGEQNTVLIGLIDVSDRVRAQATISRLQGEMAHSARVSVLGELTASIAHEVSQPLTAIQTNTEASLLWLQHTPPNVDEVRDLSTRTASEVQRASDIIQRIRSMAVHAAPVKTDVQLNQIVEEALLFLRHELQRNDVNVVLQLQEELPIIGGDRVQLQQVVVNLAMNAIQAMAARNDRRQLMVRTFANSERLHLRVEDTGPGISEDSHPRLFDSFFSTKATGMGIGLPICRSIIEAHGGRIWAENRLDRSGAVFLTELPIPASVTDWE